MAPLFLLACSSPSKKSSSDLTAKTLLEGSKVPARRNFPLSTTVKPCEDFHRYVCEPTESTFDLPADRSTWLFSFSDSAERILHAKKNFFKMAGSGFTPKLKRTENVIHLYKACMNEKARAEEEKAFVQSQKEAILGVKAREQMRDLLKSRLLSADFSIVNAFDLTKLDDPTINDVAFLSAGMSLPEKRTYQEKDALQDLEKLAKALFEAAGADQADARAKDVVDFEQKLAKSYLVPEKLRKRFTVNTTITRAKLLASYPELGLDRVLAKVPAKTGVRDIVPSSLKFLNQSVKTAPVRQLQSVLLYHTLRTVMDDGYPEYYKVFHDFQNRHFGAPPIRPPRDERCTRLAMGHLGMELDAELIEILYPDFQRKSVVELGEQVRSTIVDGLKKNKWLSESARAAAIEKIQKADLKLVRPERDEDWDFLKVDGLSSDRPLANEKMIAEAEVEEMLRKIAEPRNRNLWYMSPLTVNAYYSADDNQFVLPQGILQYPFFDAQISRVQNLGAMGMVVGHELGHGIDDEGAKFDSQGRLRTWMSKSDLKEFAHRGEKLVAQFDKVGHNGKLTLGENIGDNVGLRFALETAFSNGKTDDMAKAREFFEAYGRVWCTVQRPEAVKAQLKTNPHALPRERINQQVIHQDLFYQAFQCKAGDKMFLEPKGRVQVW